jgi:hypothetical protein
MLGRSCRLGPRGWPVAAAFEILVPMSTLLIGCSDGRIARPLEALIDDIGQPDANRMLVPGGPLPLTRPGSERRVALSCVRELVEAHDVRLIVLVSHQECTAYERALGGLGFDQRELLERDLRTVKRLLENEFSGVDVRCFVIPWHENGEGAAFGPAAPVE